MWTIAASNKKLKGPLGTYNGLTDVHLAHFFSAPTKVSHLKEAKLITADGSIIPEQKVKIQSIQYEKRKKLYELLAQSVIQNAAHKEGSLNKRLFDYLEDVSKMETVENIKVFNKKLGRTMSSAFRKKKATVLPFEEYSICDWLMKKNNEKNIPLQPRSAPSTSEFTLKNDILLSQSNLSKSKRCCSAIETSPYVIPLFITNSQKSKSLLPINQIFSSSKKKKKLKPKPHTRETTNHELEIKSKKISLKLFTSNLNFREDKCKITILYHGHGLFTFIQNNLKEEIIIKQQHCGGTPVTVYKGEIAPNATATFTSLTHEGFPFSLTIFLDGIRYLKLSSCCVFRYPINRRLGGSNGNFSIKKIEGGKRCLKCQYEESETCSYNLNNKANYIEDELNENFKINDTAEINEEEKPIANEIPDDSEASISEKDELEQFENSIKSDEEDVEENLSAKSDLQDAEIEDNIPENTNENDSASDPDSIVSIAESVQDNVNSNQEKMQGFQSDSSSEGENGKHHVVMASIHGSPS